MSPRLPVFLLLLLLFPRLGAAQEDDSLSTESLDAVQFGLMRDFGEGVGWRRGVTRFDVFAPLSADPGVSLLFADFRGNVFDDYLSHELSAGGGVRWSVDSFGALAGINAYFDYRDTSNASFLQDGIGFEWLGPYFDFRANAYIPVGDRVAVLSDGAPGSTGPVFRGHDLLLVSQRTVEFIRPGYDAEIGSQLPVFVRFDPRAYVGYYHYSGELGPTIDGIRGRLTAQVTQRLALQAQVQHDEVFQTTVSGGVAFYFGGPNRDTSDGFAERWYTPVVRPPSVVTDRIATNCEEVAIDPVTGAPIVFQHASAASAGGDGTFERPFRTLADLQAGSSAGDVLVVRNGNYTGGMTLKTGQRMLGDGTIHTVNARQGTLTLPTIMPGAVPMITVADQPSEFLGFQAAVVLAPNTEVSGMTIDLANQQLTHGISGFASSGGFNINRNTIRRVNIEAIHLNQITGAVSITGNVLANTGMAGAVLTDLDGPVLFADNTISNNGTGGVVFRSGAATNATWNLRNNVLTGNGAPPPSGKEVLVPVGFTGDLRVNLIDNNSDTGFGFIRLGPSPGAFRFFADNNVGTINNAGATQVFTPFP